MRKVVLIKCSGDCCICNKEYSYTHFVETTEENGTLFGKGTELPHCHKKCGKLVVKIENLKDKLHDMEWKLFKLQNG